MAYRSQDRRDRWKAMVAAVAVTAVLGAGILTGLNVRIIGQTVDRLRTFDISLPEIPPPTPPPQPRQAQQEEGAPAAPEASPVVAPEPEIEVPTRNPVAAAPEAGAGAASTAVRGGVGTGTGAGGTGTGAGAGSGFTPARITRRIPNSEYRRISAGRVPTGSATIRFVVTPQGRMTNCRVVRSSGDSYVDSVLCRIATARMRFAPARDPSGRPVAQDMAYTPTWRPR